ncbi:toxin [Paenibacillus mesophilus]|nr:toxin [Paenibacillus mesophilus]
MMFERNQSDGNAADRGPGMAAPSISLPKGGGAIRGIAEKFAATPITGTGSMSIPLALSPGRSGFGPTLSLSYNSGSGNGPYGFGWTLSIPAISRKTDKGLPLYEDAEESDLYVLSGAEDLVPCLLPDGSTDEEATADGYMIRRYRPRIEGLFARIERLFHRATGTIHWRVVTRDNVTTIYGDTSDSRVADPSEPSHIFSWLATASWDSFGNAVVYEYAAENGENVDMQQAAEHNRVRSANRYLKRVKYGNKVSRLIQPDMTLHEWMFEAVFDYDEGHLIDIDTAPAVDPPPGKPRAVTASVSPVRSWSARPDPFSFYRAGFEVRTHRRCRRVLMFHRFDELGPEPCLVRSTEFEYADFDYAAPSAVEAEIAHPGSTRTASFLCAVTESGYIRDGAEDTQYMRHSLPPLSFRYSKPTFNADIRELNTESGGRGSSEAFEGGASLWVDLNGEGIPGLLTEQAGAWLYEPNLGGGRLGPRQTVAAMPNLAYLAGGRQQLADITGDGKLDLVLLDGPHAGFFERAGDDSWHRFQPFRQLPNIPWDEPNVTFIDLDGDGRADVLFTEHELFSWHSMLADEGFGPARQVQLPFDEDRGPRLVLADGVQSIYLADMCGDGLNDFVRIRNGEVCYWPNLGYGRFGAKIVMDNAPWFDYPDQFNQKRIRLADLDGSGVTDIVYIGRDEVKLFLNQSGNRWSGPIGLGRFPLPDRLDTVAAVDLLGSGTSCLVWTASVPGEARRSIRYVDLLDGKKPHLLVGIVNNTGGETDIAYASSTKFYLADKLDGNGWKTKLPFPVHVIERVETRDRIVGSRFVTRYAYHHGYYDGEEGEFRGFGMVEQWDTESFADGTAAAESGSGAMEPPPELNQPPVMTRTWFHTGACFEQTGVLHPLRDQYYLQKPHTDEPVMPEHMDVTEWRECVRTLKGLALRQEVYSFDGSAQERHPYSVSENRYEVKRLQRRGKQMRHNHAVFMTVSLEIVSLYYERNPHDPRITQVLNLKTDELGHSLQSCTVVYGRSANDPSLPAEVSEAQSRLYITCAEADYTADRIKPGPLPAYRLRTPYETRTYEITGAPHRAGLYRAEDMQSLINAASSIPYEALADGTTAQKRLLSHNRTLFLDDSLAPLPLGEWDTLGLVHQTYRLAFTPGAVGHYAGKVTDVDLAAAGYVHFQNDDGWWVRSGTAIYPADPAAHFYIPVGAKDPLGVETVADLDRYDLLVERVRVKQADWSVLSAVNDYRTLGPVMTTDPNKNRAAVQIDALGMVVRSAVMGKEGSDDGDTLADPTTRLEYELFNWMNEGKPNRIRLFAREQHGAANTGWKESCLYWNGSGGVAMAKTRAAPGKALRANPDGTLREVDADPRWVGNGRTVLNNKGNPVKQYEPYFSTTLEYEDEKALREIGVSPRLWYDALGRNIRTDYPNGTFGKVEFDPWKQRIFDANDTVKESRWYAERGSPDPAVEPEPLADPERRSAWLAAKHAGTPSEAHLDSLGRPVYAISDYGAGKKATVRSESDLTGRFTAVFDQEKRQVSTQFTGMAGTPIYCESAEKGRRWMFPDAVGAIVKTWDEHGREFRTGYDDLHRPVSMYVREPGQNETLFNYVVYGDRHPEGERLNLLGAAHQLFDTAGMVRVAETDFKGNPLRIERVLAKAYKNDPDWQPLAAQPGYDDIQTAAAPLLAETEVFTASSMYDARNRPTQVTLPDGTVMSPTYNEADVLSSLQAQIRGQGALRSFLLEQDYDAKGQRQFAHYGNGVVTRYRYERTTNRLASLQSYKQGGEQPDAAAMQLLRYTYDPVGNIVHIRDEAQQTHFFNNAVVKPEQLYEYDAVYQLIRATGREQAGLAGGTMPGFGDLDFAPNLPHANDTDAVRTYTEHYEYDLLGNLTAMRHRFKSETGAGSGWTRRYRYSYEDDPADRTNRLLATSASGDPDNGPYSEAYRYDQYGNMIAMPHLPTLDWNYMDQLRQVDLGGGGTAYYVNGAGGQRVRKVIERPGGFVEERIYLGNVEIYRERQNGSSAPSLERQTLHISDNAGRIAQVDTKTKDESDSDPANPLNVPLIRYTYGNHLGSAVLETDADGTVISYEEYHPFGTTAYRSAKSGVDRSLKRYRFSGKERDAETGLYYFGARYYAPWLGRWTSSDPAGFVNGPNLFQYCRNNPVMLGDRDGKQASPAGRVSWEIPSWVYQAADGSRLSDADATANFERWMGQSHPDRRFTPGSVTIDWSTMRGRRGPTFNADWLRGDGSRLLPDPGQVGSVAQHDQHPPALRAVPGDTSSARLSEDEHMMPKAQLQDMTTDPDTGTPGYTDRRYSRDSTMRADRTDALTKTHGNRGGPTADNPTTRSLRGRVAAGGTVDYREDIFERSRRQAIASGMPEEAVNRAILEQEGNLFSINPTTLSDEDGPSPHPSSPPPSSSTPGGSSGGGSGARPPSPIGSYARAGGAELARSFIPGFVEAEIAGIFAHSFVVGTLGITSGPLPVVAEAISAAPTSFAASVTLPAFGGAVVGNIVESAVLENGGSRELSIGAAVLTAGGTGAVIGTFIPIPGVGTAAGALIGAGIGIIGYGISKLF